MKLYLDASAWIKRYIDEPGSDDVERAMNSAEIRVIGRFGFVETLRKVELDGPDRRADLLEDWRWIESVDTDQSLCEAAVRLAIEHRLRALDALHLAAALHTELKDLTFATWDKRLHAAAEAEGFEMLPATLD